MKKEYMKPSMTAIELQHMTRLMTGSGDMKGLQSSGWEDQQEDELDLSDQGGGSSIWDR